MWGDYMTTRISAQGAETALDISKTWGQKLLNDDEGCVRLWVGVIKQAIKEKDIAYLSGGLFEEHCSLLSVNSDLIINAIPNKILRKQILAKLREIKS